MITTVSIHIAANIAYKGAPSLYQRVDQRSDNAHAYRDLNGRLKVNEGFETLDVHART